MPEDLSVVGFDDVEIAAEVAPSLTTVNVPASKIGRIAADHLVSAIAGNRIPLATRIDAPLVFRDLRLRRHDAAVRRPSDRADKPPAWLAALHFTNEPSASRERAI